MKCKKQMLITMTLTCALLFLATSSNADTAIVNTDTLKLRQNASTDSDVLELLNEGEKLEVIEQEGNWVKVKAKNMTGYVHKDYVKIQKDKTTQTQNSETEEKENTVEENTEQNNTVTEKEDNNETTFTITQKVVKEKTEVFILPLINASKIATLNKNAQVIIMDEVNHWAYVQTDNTSGWIRSDVLTEQKTTEKEDTKTSTDKEESEDTNKEESNEKSIKEKVMYVNYSSIYVRKEPSTKAEVVDSLILNAQVTVIAETGDWYKVKIDDETGYIAKRLLSTSKTQESTRNAQEREEEPTTTVTSNTLSKGEEIVNYAKQYLGLPYVYGGSGPSSFDCSGFTMYVYKHFGISLSHSAIAQANNGSYVAKSDLQLGDLVFFKDYETMDGIGHCGIYIGDGNFIHASSGTGYCVKISTLLSGSYATRYETARRLI